MQVAQLEVLIASSKLENQYCRLKQSLGYVLIVYVVSRPDEIDYF